MRALSITSAIGRDGPWNQDFFGHEMATSEAIAIIIIIFILLSEMTEKGPNTLMGAPAVRKVSLRTRSFPPPGLCTEQ